MNAATRYVNIKVDGASKYQKIDGFGVNINSKCWDNGNLVPVMEMLIDDLGATLFRIDAYGKSNWVDPENKFDASVLNQETYDRVYDTIEFKNAMAMCKFLNSRGIEPYITMSGVVPKWMCSEDGATLSKYEEFAEMAASYAKWLRDKAGIKFTLFSPLNETDIGPPEGPKVSPEEYVKVCEVLVDTLDKYGLGDIKLAVSEQGYYSTEYIKYLLSSSKLNGRIGVFTIHQYWEFDISEAMNLINESNHSTCPFWMTEYGDLDQSGEKEWYVAWVCFERLMSQLNSGVRGSLNWDAYDNYHDHDECWTIYGLLRYAGCLARKYHTPKKRYYSTKQMYHFVRPGFTRIHANTSNEEVPVLAFTNDSGSELTVVGMNNSDRNIFVNIDVEGLDKAIHSRKADVYRTSETENCAKVATVNVSGTNCSYPGVDLSVPAQSIFTVTTIK